MDHSQDKNGRRICVPALYRSVQRCGTPDVPEFANVSAAIFWAAGVSNILSDALDTEEDYMLLEATGE
jgi:hypothetical protein